MSDLTGQTFGKLTAVERSGSKRGYVTWMCICVCGISTYVRSSHLRNGQIQSCGCSRKGRQIDDLTGSRFNKVYVLSLADVIHGHAQFHCMCQCGRKFIAVGSKLKSGGVQSCGCARKMVNSKNLVGQRFGRVVVIGIAPSRANYRDRSLRWMVKCDCGQWKIISGACLRSGETDSCGCRGRDHGKKLGEWINHVRWYPFATETEYHDLQKTKKLWRELTNHVRQQRNERETVAS